MRSEVTNKKWGTIYLGGNKEATLESIDAMQAAARQEQWNQRTQNDYLERVRERATDRAREILGAAHTERQNILAEARSDAERIRLETQVQYDKADKALADAEAIRAEAQSLRDEAEAIRNAAQQEGFDTGLANARDELDAFRGAMGASIGVVLQAIERQNAAIFAAWREELVALVQTCVNKGTEWVLQDQHAAVLRALVMESVRQLDNRHSVTLRVHPDDEAAVADMFAAAREAMPDVDRWIVQGDDSVALGGLIAESPTSTVDNRVALRSALVENILQHLTLPEGEAEIIAAAAVHDVVCEQVAHIATLAPPVPEPEVPSQPMEYAEEVPAQAMEQAEAPMTDAEPQAYADIAADAVLEAPVPAMTPEPAMAAAPSNGADTDMPDDSVAELHTMADMPAMPQIEDMPAMPSQLEDMPTLAETQALTDSDSQNSPFPVADMPSAAPVQDSVASPQPAMSAAPLPDLTDMDADTPMPASEARADNSVADIPVPPEAPASLATSSPSLAELEEELLPLPAENSPAVDAVLAGGGFLSDDDSLGQKA